MSGKTKTRIRVVIVAVAVVFAVVVTYSLAGLFWATNGVRSDVAATVSGFDTGDFAAADGALVRLQESSTELASVTNGPIWTGATNLPLVGDSVSALNTMATALVDLSSALKPITEPLAGSSTTSERVARVSASPEQLRIFAESAETAAAHIDGIEASNLLFGLDQMVRDFQVGLPVAASAATRMADAAQALPAMLGMQGRRVWLVLFENAGRDAGTEGNLAGYMLVEFIDGRATVLETETISSLIGNPRDAAPVTAALTDTEADFSAVARQAALTLRSQGTAIDGVVVLDSDMLEAVVASTGPVEHRGVSIDGSSTTTFFTEDLSNGYPDLPGEESKDRLAMGVVSAALIAFLNRPVDLSVISQAAPAAAAAGHVRVWSPRAEETEWLRGLGISDDT